jgi:molecular chaperone DnaJ
VTPRREWLEKDYYAVLGVDRTASAREIKSAYRKLAQKYHPDSNPDDPDAEQRFKEASEAHAVLSNAETRKEYDQTRDAFARGAYAGGPGGGTQYVTVEDLGDLFGGFGGFSDLFGQSAGRRAGPRPGGDTETEVRLSFHEAVQGTTRTMSIDGRDVTVKIPAGVADGGRVRVRGKGMPGSNGGPAGDLYVTVHTGSHPIFEREGKNLAVTVPISFTEAALGANVTAPTLEGTVTLKVPPGTPSGKTFRVSGKGISTPQGNGDLLVTVDVTVPEQLSDEEREVLERLRDLESDRNPRAHLGV